MRTFQLLKIFSSLFLSAFLIPLMVAGQTGNNYNDENMDGLSDDPAHFLLDQSPGILLDPTDTGDVVHSIPTPGTNTQALTWDGNYLWCGDIDDDFVYQVDPLDGAVNNSYQLTTGLLEGLAWDGTYLWGSDNETDIIYQFNPDDGSVVSSLQFSNVWIHGITWDGQNLWINDFISKTIMKVDPQNGDILHTINAPGTSSIGLAWDGVHLWSDDFNTDKLYCIDPEDGSIIYEVDAPTDYPRDLTWDGEFLWVLSAINSTIYQVDVAGVTGIVNPELPDDIRSFSVYPNPYTGDILYVVFEIDRKMEIEIGIYNQNGALVSTVESRNFTPGRHKVVWNGKTDSNGDVSSGTYYCVLNSGSSKSTLRFVVSKSD